MVNIVYDNSRTQPKTGVNESKWKENRDNKGIIGDKQAILRVFEGQNTSISTDLLYLRLICIRTHYFTIKRY